MPTVVFTPLTDSTDRRGASFSLPAPVLDALPGVRDVHLAAIRPGAIRGNHYHAVKSEVLTVVYTDAWSFHWDTGAHTAVQSREFTGSGAVAITVPVDWSHAVRNDGAGDLWMVNLTDLPYHENPDSYAREVVR